MSNQFYKYLSQKLIEYFRSIQIKSGDKFYFNAEKQDQIDMLYTVLQKEGQAEPFTYISEKGAKYETYFIPFENTRLIVAATIDDITPDYLVTIRNLVGGKDEQWHDTALLTLVNKKLDSIAGGGSSLHKKGMPFYVQTIKNELQKEIQKSKLNKANQTLLQYYLEQNNDDFIQQSQTIFDFEEILSLTTKEEIEKNDYEQLGFFYDSNLLTDDDTRIIKKRLEENKDLYNKIEHIHSFGNPETDLEKLFDDKGMNKLKKDGWRELDFKDVKVSFDNNKKLKPLEFSENTKKVTTEGNLYWERADKETAAGRRKRHIIIFNTNQSETVELSFKFNENVKKEFFLSDTGSFTEASGKSLKVKIPHVMGETTFRKVAYKHNNESKSNFEFRIAVVDCTEELLAHYKAAYSVNALKKNSTIELQTEEDTLIFHPNGDEEEEFTITESNEVFSLDDVKKNKIVIDSEIDDSNISFAIEENGNTIPLKVKIETRVITPISGRYVWKTKREKEEHFIYSIDGKLLLGNDIFTPKEEFKISLEIEKQLLEQDVLYGEINHHQVTGFDLAIDDSIQESYKNLIHYYKKNNTLPSLAYMDDELKELSEKYVASVSEAIQAIEAKSYMTHAQKELSKLGVLLEKDKVLFTPLHPINVVYQIKINEMLRNEQISEEILKCLKVNNLSPFYIENNKLYKVTDQQHSFEWTYYGYYKSVTNDENKLFTATLVKNKLKEFMNHFQYLFVLSKKAPIKVNLVNLENDLEYLQGICSFLKNRIEKSKDENDIVPIEVTIYQKTEYTSAFELFSDISDLQQIEEHLQIPLQSSKLDKQDVLRIFREKIFFTKQVDNKQSYNYAHVSFVRMYSNDEESKSVMSDIVTGTSIEGLLSGIPSISQNDSYRTGFGTKYALLENNQLVSFASLYNELVANMANSGSEPYQKEISTVTLVSSFMKESLEQLYKASNWVTFIDPKVDLEFFQSEENSLIIIHYSDQYTTSSGYDSITVTNKTNQYKIIIQEFLDEHNIKINKIDDVINWFNVVNGEWLLKLIGNSSQFPKEKLSIISAIKYGMSYLAHDDIVWVPVSMEEVLRVSGAVGLKKEGGIFSVKNVSSSGVHSDDLLFIGVEITDEEVKVHYHPTEVKIGINNSGTLNKAKTQIDNTKKLLMEKTRLHDDEGNVLFANKFYRNFFMQLFITNIDKLALYGLIDEEKYEKINEKKCALLNDNYSSSYDLEPICGEASIISFTKDTHFRTVSLGNGILKLDLTLFDGYKGIVETVSELSAKMRNGETDLSIKYMPYYEYKKEEYAKVTQPVVQTSTDKDEVKVEETGEPEKVAEKQPSLNETVQDGKIEVLFGSNLMSSEEIYWKPTDTTILSHPNTGIIGTMGTGKTQFTKSLIAQLVKNSYRNINGTKLGILIFDYKGDYISEEFLSKVNGKKYDLFHLPYNPLSIFAANNSMPLVPLHTARGITTTLEKAFNLGELQSSILLDTIMEAYERKGIHKVNKATWSNIAPTFHDVYRIFMEDEDVKKDKLHKVLKDLNDFEIFEPDGDNTVPLFELLDGVTVINLQGYDEAIQNLVVAITLDLFYIQMQQSGDSSYNGNYRELRKFVLVDEADNFMSKDFDSLKKILKEGRSFGVGTILSTQLLSHFSTGSNDYADYILSWVVHNVTDIKTKDIKYIFNTTTNDETENILHKIKQLQKHQSIIKLGNRAEPVLIRDKAFWELDLQPVEK